MENRIGLAWLPASLTMWHRSGRARGGQGHARPMGEAIKEVACMAVTNGNALAGATQEWPKAFEANLYEAEQKIHTNRYSLVEVFII